MLAMLCHATDCGADPSAVRPVVAGGGTLASRLTASLTHLTSPHVLSLAVCNVCATLVDGLTDRLTD